ncbi:MAG: hypothetical protein KAS87_04310 [Candidatus Omnitrophica bacterium]|nr:hypothetical protein [Candidatus Omnitrophota bacterium]
MSQKEFTGEYMGLGYSTILRNRTDWKRYWIGSAMVFLGIVLLILNATLFFFVIPNDLLAIPNYVSIALILLNILTLLPGLILRNVSMKSNGDGWVI